MNTQGFILTIWCLLFLPAATWAQGVVTASIAGVVRDSSGGVLPGATVEAASPALIEKVRSSVSDSQGRFQIADLRPGVYAVTFTMQGFSKVTRTGVELTTGFTATVNAELAVGSVEETVTVAGTAPLVDTRSVVQQTTLAGQTLDALPTTRRMGSYATLVPGATGNSQDVGGLQGERGAAFAIHGGRSNEININQDGVNLTMLNSAVYSFNPYSTQEVAVEVSGTSAETFSGGVRVNIVPKDGGNTFAGMFGFTYSNPSLQSDNLSDELRDRGLTATPSLRQSYQVGGGLGGPVKQDKLWFFTAHRKWVASQYVPGNFYNKLQGTLFYEPDRSRPAYSDDYFRSHNIRLTWQASAKDRVALSVDVQDDCNCPNAVDGTIAPEANGNHHYNPDYAAIASWNRPATNRLLFEGGSSVNKTTINSKRPLGTSVTDIAVNDTGLGVSYGARAGNITTGNIGNPCCYSTQADNTQFSERLAVSYITGSHAFKTGANLGYFTFRNKNENAIDQIHGARLYTFNNRDPRSVTIYATPLGRASNSTTFGAFAQDRWTVGRLTLNLGLRYDSFNAVATAQHFAAGYFAPERNFPEVKDNPVWKNLNPRLGAAYDLFGTGKTALKVDLGRYVLGTSSSGNNNVALDQPILRQANSATRTWNDKLFGPNDPRTGNFVPDCVLGPSIPALNGECGALSDQTFGQLRTQGSTTYAADVLSGFQDAQSYLWRGSVSFQHELRQGLGLSIGYFRTSYGNFQVTDNLATTSADYDTYCITAPTDSRLPNSGSRICGLYDVKPAVFGQVNNLITQARNFGKQTDVFNGVDININARFGTGGQLQGGVSTGREVTDNCFANGDPSVLAPGAANAATVANSPRTDAYCRESPPWSAGTQVKFLVVYPLPWSFRASAVYQNVPGIAIGGTYVATNAEIRPSLLRDLGSCRGLPTCNANATITVVPTNSLFEPRLQQVDLRFARTVRIGRVRVEGDLDLYNVFNASNVLQLQPRLGPAWQNALQILAGRLVRVGAQITF